MPNYNNPIFHEYGVSNVEFYARAFVVNHRQIQQYECQTRCEGFLDQEDPRPIEDLIGGDVENQKKERLGKNLLDSFALIFAQPRGEGVVATVMESNKDHTIYTLNISINDPSIDLTGLAKEIEAWFADRTPDVANTITISRQSSLWRCILLKHCHNISESIFQACIGKTEKDKESELLNTLRCIRDTVNIVPPKLIEAREGTLNILRSLETFFSTSPSVFFKIQSLEVNGELLDNDSIKLLHNFMQLCFNLAETCVQDMREFFSKLEENRRGDLLWRILRLIYTLSNYIRAWYDIVYFKDHHRSATLRINLQLGHISTTSGPYQLEWGGIADTVIGTRMLDEERVPRMKNSRSVRNNLVDILQHCEMQMLRFLRLQSTSNYFNYIGCSRCPCWLCYHVLVNIRSKFNMRQSHLKLYAQWDPPDFLLEEHLQFLNEEMGRLADPTIEANWTHRITNSDSPDIEETFLSPRSVPGYEIGSVEQ